MCQVHTKEAIDFIDNHKQAVMEKGFGMLLGVLVMLLTHINRCELQPNFANNNPKDDSFADACST